MSTKKQIIKFKEVRVVQEQIVVTFDSKDGKKVTFKGIRALEV